MKDVARAAGLSRSAVSLALRRDPSIPEATRQRVEAAARKVGYRPNPMIGALMSELRGGRKGNRKETCTIAFIDLNPKTAPGGRRVLHRLYFEGARRQARELGYEVVPFTLSEQPMTLKRLRQILRNRGIQGVILAPLNEAHAPLDIDWSPFSIASLSYTTKEHFHLCTHHHYANMNLALQTLREKGYRRIGFCTSARWDDRVEGLYSAAYLHTQLVDRSLANLPVCLIRKHAGFRKTFAAWLEEARPEVLISSFGFPFFDTFRELGVSVPGDLGFVSLSCLEQHKDFAGIYECPEDIGALALDSVSAQMQRNERGIPEKPKVILREGVWQDGSTLP